jgi:hypothetical protein
MGRIEAGSLHLHLASKITYYHIILDYAREIDEGDSNIPGIRLQFLFILAKTLPPFHYGPRMNRNCSCDWSYPS